MKAVDPTGGPGDINDRKHGDRRAGGRAPRRTQQGPIGFGQVFGMVRRGGQRAGVDDRTAAEERQATGRDDRTRPEHASGLHHHAAASHVDDPARTLHAHDITITDASSLQSQNARAAAEAQLTPSTRVSPERAMQLIEDVARELGLERGAREIHLELEPAHLGPIVVRLMVDRGRLRTELRAARADAAARLGSGAAGLRSRLEALGYAHVEVDVRHDEEAGPGTI